MAADQERFSSAFSFVLKNGVEVFPVQMKRLDTGRIAFRVSPGGTGGNKLDLTEEVDEATMIRMVLHHHYAVRCASKDGKIKGQYKAEQRSVVEVRLGPGRGARNER